MMTDVEKEDQLKEHLPHRMRALSSCELICRLMLEFGPEVPFRFTFGSAGPWDTPSARFLTNPITENGIIHARALLDFLGIRVNRRTEALEERQGKHDPSDIVAEEFGAARVSLALFRKEVSVAPSAPEETAIVHTLLAANKSVAHHAQNSLPRMVVPTLLFTCQATLHYMRGFYASLNRPAVLLLDVEDILAQMRAGGGAAPPSGHSPT